MTTQRNADRADQLGAAVQLADAAWAAVGRVAAKASRAAAERELTREVLSERIASCEPTEADRERVEALVSAFEQDQDPGLCR